MADYGDLIELGFEGVDRVIDKHYDGFHDHCHKHKPKWFQQKNGIQAVGVHSKGVNGAPGATQSRGILAQQDYGHGGDSRRDRRSRSQSQSRSRRNSRRDMDRSDNEEDYRRLDTRNRGYEREVQDRSYNDRAGQRGVSTRDSDVRFAGAVVPRAASPPSLRSYAPGEYAEPWTGRDRPYALQRRSSSWSTSRRQERHGPRSPSRRARSKSPSHYRAAAVLVGALAGGMAGNQMKKGDQVPNTVSTVAGAVLGALATREAEKAYDRRKEKREKEDDKRRERRERRHHDR